MNKGRHDKASVIVYGFCVAFEFYVVKLAGNCGRDSRGAKRWRLAANVARAEPRIARFCEAKAAQILKMHIFGEMYDKYF